MACDVALVVVRQNKRHHVRDLSRGHDWCFSPMQLEKRGKKQYAEINRKKETYIQSLLVI